MTAAERPARRASFRWILLAGVLFVGALVCAAVFAVYLRSARQPVASSTAARSVSAAQSRLLLQELAKHPAYSITINTDASDSEARHFADQLYDTLRNSQWHVDLSTNSSGPPPGTGLCITQTGEDSRPPYPDISQDPYFYLPDAFKAADIYIGSESGQSSGEYKLFLVVGHRNQPEAAQRHGYLLHAAERWLLRHLAGLRRRLG